MPHLRVVAGTSLEDLHPITVNTGTSHSFASDIFEGAIVAHIKDFPGPNGDVLESEYFEREDKKGITWSIQVQGRFLRPISADDVVFGNTFDRPLQLPWGVSAAFRFMKYVDPTLDHDLASKTKPWALSPLVSTMPHFAHARVEPGESLPPFPPVQSLDDDVSSLHLAVLSAPTSPASSLSSSRSGSSESVATSSSYAASFGSDKEDESPLQHKRSAFSVGSARKIKDRLQRHRAQDDQPASTIAEDIKSINDAHHRRSYFADAEHRKGVVFGPNDVLTTDFCYGFINFMPSLSLQLPGGISFDLMRYWDGQPVRFVCCERKKQSDTNGADEVPWGRIFWCIAIQLVED